MSDLIAQRIKQLKAITEAEEKLALRELIQEISLLGLWRSKFYEHAAFYGGTSLRILYGLDRFSEDLDFTLLKKNPDFKMAKYLKAIATELTSFGFQVTVESKAKKNLTPIQSAFVKANAQVSFLVAKSKFKPQKDSLIKVKIEVDTDGPTVFNTEAKQFFWPQPFTVLTCDKPSLMAGKLHATFCRGVRKNVKGRDWYDFLWYTAQAIQPNWNYLEEKMRDSGHWSGEFSVEKFKKWANDQIDSLDINAAKSDIQRFIKDQNRLNAWSIELFKAAVDRLI